MLSRMARLHPILSAAVAVVVLACGPGPAQVDPGGESSATDSAGETTLGSETGTGTDTDTDTGQESSESEDGQLPDFDLGEAEHCDFVDRYFELEVAKALELDGGPVPVELAATLTHLYTGPSLVDHYPSTLEGIDCLVNLETLHPGAGTLDDLGPLVSLAKLRHLTLRNQDITDLAPLAANSELNRLTLSINPIPDGALTQIAGLDLEWLNIGDTQITTLDEIPLFENLYYLEIYKLPIDDLSPIAGMPLGGIAASNTQISDLTPLLTLTGVGLEQLYIYDTQVTDLSVLLDVTWNFMPVIGTCPVLSVNEDLIDAQSKDFVIPTLCDMGVNVNGCLFCPQ